MTGQDIQTRVDALVNDLQTTGKGQTVNIMFRNPDNTPNILPLSSDVNGVVNAAQLIAVQNFLDDVSAAADTFTTESAPVSAALDAFKAAQVPHEGLTETARVARVALQDALAGDATYQTAKTALDNARADADYQIARTAYENLNVSENYAALAQAKGEYIV